tara:strand:- start:69 stop:389 length:321 start_codon:yes stop_codon:yes gene_type:complete
MFSILPALLFSTVVAAEPYWAEKPVECGTLKTIKSITDKFGEVPFITMDGYGSQPEGRGTYRTKVIITVNTDTYTWTIIEFPNPQFGCILGSGTSLQKLIDIGISL